MLVKDGREKNDDDCHSINDTDVWCSEEDLPEDTRCKIEGLKAMARWLLGKFFSSLYINAVTLGVMVTSFLTQLSNIKTPIEFTIIIEVTQMLMLLRWIK